MSTPEPDTLFAEFSPVSKAEWKAKASAELGEKPFNAIVWKTENGFALEPWYSSDESSDLPVPVAPDPETWRMCRKIPVTDTGNANENARQSLREGATALEFVLSGNAYCTHEQLLLLLQDIDTTLLPVYFSGEFSPTLLLDNLLSITAFKNNSGGILVEKVDEYEAVEAALVNHGSLLENYRILSVSAVNDHENGASASEEIAFLLAGVSDSLYRLQAAGIPAETAARKIEIVLAVGPSHFTELAKIRAVRFLLQHILKAYGAPTDHLPRIFARTSERNLSRLDPFTNLLRQTTEAVSAIFGGCQTLQISPFDNGLSVSHTMAERVSGNIHLLLQREAGLDRVSDPARGSCYIEQMTRELSRSAWSLFRDIETAGGLNNARKSGMIDSLIRKTSEKRVASINTRSKTIVGVNRYPGNLTIQQEENLSEIRTILEKRTEGNESGAFELLRINTIMNKTKTGHHPAVFFWMQGDTATSFRQAAFAEDFFRCGGFDIAGSAQLVPEESSFQTVLDHKPAVLVLCIAEKDPCSSAETIARNLHTLDPELLMVMAGKPPQDPEPLFRAGIDSFIHTGVNIIDHLTMYQHKTGVQ
ncbi:MAG: methylmalonyl-CoA mutase subunit beta [Chlorobium sp.]|jgi:methylmalonyl-CoA mutase|nr:methylmalonyl-CoA mutase subunit beta [Chlorobium sp.]